MTVRERPLSFGADGTLFGILSLPSEGPRLSPVLIPNAGIVHHVGPHRLHVRLARHLASLGHPVLRFDLHGLGESGPPAPHLSYEAQAVEDISAAIDAVRADEVTLIGLCSGADNAMRAAESEARIARMILLDPHAYGSMRAKAARWAEKALDGDRWRRAAGRVLAGGGVDAVPSAAGDDAEDRLPIPKEDFARQILAVTGRGGRVLIRYTDFVQDTLTEPGHFFAAFPETRFGDGLTVEVDPDADHTYMALSAQARLKGRIGDWLAEEGRGQ